MPARLVQHSFAGGELAPNLWGRADHAKYSSGLAVCRNFIPTAQGPVKNRPGTQYIATTKDPTRRVRVLGFRFSTVQNYEIELGHLYARFYMYGGPILA